jgi:hypothetical protein
VLPPSGQGNGWSESQGQTDRLQTELNYCFKTMTKRPLIIAAVAIFIIASIAAALAYKSKRASQFKRAWFEGDPHFSLSGLRLRCDRSAISIENSNVFLSFNTAIKKKTFSPSPYGGACEAELQINGEWCGASVLSCSAAARKIVLGIPHSTDFLEREYDYGELELDGACVKEIESAIEDMRKLSE